ncbi:MAG TPA: hypothetical protein VIH95_08730 [Acidimicrobiales bacterium]
MLADAFQAAHSAIAQIVAIAVGTALVVSVLLSAVETVVLPRNSFTRITRATFAVANRVLVHDGPNRERSTRRRGLYAPVALVTLPLVWMLAVIIGFTLIFWGADAGTWQKSFEVSGSSVTTLGFSPPSGSLRTWISFVEAIIGLGLVALLISYLPTIYAAHHDREKGIRTLRPFAGTPPSGVALLLNLSRFHSVDNPDLWRTASSWLLELDQTHCSFPALCYFPESDDTQSWVATVGALLDAGALLLSANPIQWTDATTIEHQGAMIVLANGVPTIIEIGRAAGLPIAQPVPLVELLPDGSATAPAISISRDEYMSAIDQLEGIISISDDQREDAWLRFAAVRASYDEALRGLAGLTFSLSAQWTTDRPAHVGRPRLLTNKPISVNWWLTDPDEDARRG